LNISYSQTSTDQSGTAYIGNIEYNTLNGNNSLTTLSRIYNDEGYVENPANPQYYYFRHDHLGDNREVWCANTNTVAQRTQYYPSGLPWAYDRIVDHPDLQHRKYNGKEFVEMHGYDTYDIVWRQYYPAIMRFQTPDPYAEKYYSISPYAMCGDNMVNRIDPAGKDVLIWYKDNKGNDQSYLFNGRNKMAPTNQYVLDFIKAYNFDIKNGGGQNLKKAVTNADIILNVANPENGEDQYVSDASQPTVFWNSRQGYVTTKDGHQSAATALEHEMDHAVDDAKDPKAHRERNGKKDKQYDNKEERRVIKGSETKTAKANKESINKNHKGKTYKTISPTSTKPSK